jgi:hypothetical protein
VSRADLAHHLDFLAYKFTLLFQRDLFRASRKNEGMIETRHIQFQGSVLDGKRSIHDGVNLRRRESRVLNRLRNQNGIEGFSRLWVNCPLALHQIHISMTNAIQAFQGLFGPFRSKPSDHAVDSDGGANHLR